MDPSQPGAPANSHQRMDMDDKFGALWRAATAPHAIDSAGAIIPTPPSPELDYHQYLLPRHLWPADNHQLADGARPPTPPRQSRDDGFSDLRDWYALYQQARPPQAPPDHTHLSTSPNRYLHGQYYSSNYQGGLAQCLTPVPRLHPFANLLHSSPEQQITHPECTKASPPIQQWPTNNLVDRKTRKKQEEYRKRAEAKRTGQVQSEHGPNLTSALHYRMVPEHAPAPTRKRGKRKGGFINTLVPPTPPPPLRHRAPLDGHGTSNSAGYLYRSPYAYTPGVYTPGFNPIPAQPPFGQPISTDHGQHYPTDTLGQHASYNNVPSVYGYASRRPWPQVGVIPRPEPVDREEVYQAITDNYDDYKWPIKLYELHADSAFDSAYIYMQAWFEQNVYSSEAYKWHAHATTGFIKEGNSLSILVLHNAADPFKWRPQTESTTSIGVYGRHAHTHEEIHWTTISPNVQGFFQRCPDFSIKQKWHVDMTKASEKRFHRAYWLAAKMLPLKGLLNHGLVPEKQHDAIEDIDANEVFEVAVSDLQCAWNGEQPSSEECNAAWQRILDEIGTKKVYELGSEHIVIGGTERMYHSV